MVIFPPAVAKPVKSPDRVNTTEEFADILADVVTTMEVETFISADPDNPVINRERLLDTKKNSGIDICILENFDNAPPADVKKATVA